VCRELCHVVCNLHHNLLHIAREQDRESKRPVLFEFGHEVCQISISVSVCTIDLFGRINAKLGGVNSLPRSGALEKLQSSPFMIIGMCRPCLALETHRRLVHPAPGADVGHPAPGMVNQPSVASLVYSFDRYAARYDAMMSVQHPRQEKIDELRKLVYVSFFICDICTCDSTAISVRSTSFTNVPGFRPCASYSSEMVFPKVNTHSREKRKSKISRVS
jgi:hypothetical protein